MRVLLVENSTIQALALQRDLAGRDVRIATSLSGAKVQLSQGNWQPEVIVADLNLPDSEGLATLQGLQALAQGVPIVVSTGVPAELIRQHIDLLDKNERERRDMYARLSPLPSQGFLMPRHIATEFERIGRDAIEAAVSQAIDQLMRRLGLTDEEGLRMAIRLARGWEAAKLRFVSTITTGIASACLLALGAGLMAMLRDGGPK